MSAASIFLTREVTATRIPQGEALTLPQGTPVLVTQALGGSYTVVIPSEPGLYRIDAEFADALGKTAEVAASSGPADEQAVWDTLKTCYDPEIPVNIVDLGLIYSMEFKPTPEGADVTVQMTLTAPGCGMGPIIAREAQDKIKKLPGVWRSDVQIVWEPAWTPDRISADGKQKLGMV